MAPELTDYPVVPAEGLELRPLHDADAGELAGLCNNPKIARMLRGIPHPCTRTHARQCIRESRKAWREGEGYPFAIFRRADGRLLGAARGTDRGEGTVEISYWLGEAYWGRGYASRAAAALVGFLAARGDVHRIIAGHSPDNPASGRVLRKIGMRYTGDMETCVSKGRGGEFVCRMMELGAR